MPRKNIGPGPGKYKLPPVVGYEKHDISKYRNPCYSIGLKLPSGQKYIGPGPAYGIQNMTRCGKASPPAYSMKSRPKDLTMFRPPGPGTYAPELVPRMNQPRPPMYSLSFRYPQIIPSATPGPDKYDVPSTIGPKVPDKFSSAAYSMSFKHFLRDFDKSPGPAKYTGVETSVFKTKPPVYTLSPRIFPPDRKSAAPGPIYLPKLPKKPGYSFGLRVDNDPYITAEDDMPCIERKPC
ncbi:outer dense fiber protein 3-like [Diorhabda carinulata]|uniref:outer dense fiber protein 3-like n=1 Tax=Diorhabda carinulata TaxID=1163345 RepID=UPI0025A2B6DF|nr:outer dense fiber protein 3-like [Diorhabda carinulata]